MLCLYYGMCLVLPHSCVFCFLFNCYDGRYLNIKTSVIIIPQVPLNSCFCPRPPPPSPPEKKIFSQLCKFDCYFLVLSVVPQLLYKLPVTFSLSLSLSDIKIQRETIVSMIVLNYFYVPVIQGNLKPPINNNPPSPLRGPLVKMGI